MPFLRNMPRLLLPFLFLLVCICSPMTAQAEENSPTAEYTLPNEALSQSCSGCTAHTYVYRDYCCPRSWVKIRSCRAGMQLRTQMVRWGHRGARTLMCPQTACHLSHAARGPQTHCPPGHQAYIHRTSQRRFCCPPGTLGNTITGQCRQRAGYHPPRTNTPPRTNAPVNRAANAIWPNGPCPRGYQGYIHRTSQRRFCCPRGTLGNTITGQCRIDTRR